MNRLVLFAGVTLALSSGLAAQQTDVVPPAGPVLPPTFPPATETVLANGLRLVVIEQHRQPVISLTLSVPAGSVFDPVNKEGISDLLAGLLTRGGGKRDAAAVSAAMERAGGSLTSQGGPDFITIQADMVASEIGVGLELLADAVIRPGLDPAEAERLRQQAIDRSVAGLNSEGTLGARVALLGAYRNHPYGRRATPASLAAISRQDLVSFQRARVRPAGSLLIIAGDITVAEARRLALAALGGWKGLRPSAVPVVATGPAPKQIFLVHVGGSTDATIFLSNPTYAGTDSIYYAATVLSRILGQGGDSRLARGLGGPGWASDASASLVRTSRLGLAQIVAQVSPDAVDSALTEIRSQLTALRTDLVPARELEQARQYVAGSYTLRMQTVGQIAGALSEARLLGLPASYISTYRRRILAVTAAQVRAAARRTFPQGAASIVVVGDGARLYGPLAALGPVQILAADGHGLRPDEVQPHAATLTLDPALLQPHLDSLLITVQGRAIGLQVAELTRSGDSLLYTERSAVGPSLSQVTRLVLDTTGVVRHVEQAGKVRGQDTRMALAYAGGRVRGNGVAAGAQGPVSFTADTAVTGPVLDDNAIQLLLPALPWVINTRWSFEVFTAGENRVRQMTLTAADIATTTVPAGTFETYRAELDGGPQRITFYVTTALPHRVVRVAIAGSPVEFLALNP